MIQFQENTQTDGRTKGKTEPIPQDPPSYRKRSDKYNCGRLAF